MCNTREIIRFSSIKQQPDNSLIKPWKKNPVNECPSCQQTLIEGRALSWVSMLIYNCWGRLLGCLCSICLTCVNTNFRNHRVTCPVCDEITEVEHVSKLPIDYTKIFSNAKQNASWVIFISCTIQVYPVIRLYIV